MAKPTICMSSRHQKTPCFLWTPTLTSYAFDPFANVQKFPEKINNKFLFGKQEPDYLVMFFGFFHIHDLGVHLTFHFPKRNYGKVF